MKKTKKQNKTSRFMSAAGAEYHAIKNPEYTWQCFLFGGGDESIVWMVEKAPCWFWRLMQRLAFGNKWVKIEEDKK